jgi:hypothetical protein
MLALILAATIDVTAARAAMQDLDALCRADAGKLWGVSLCGPTVFADPQTRDAVTFVDGKVDETTIAKEIGIANTGVDWNGRRWTMVMWPLPADPYARRALLAHESWHRVQEQLGFKSTGPDNSHLDDTVGRYWLRLEWRALARALETGKKGAVADALLFRERRHALLAKSAEQERLLEMHEGLAEYTGTAMAERRVAARVAELEKALKRADGAQNYVRSFAYTSGPAWGALIEMRAPKWTRSLKAGDDLGLVAQRVWKVAPAANADKRAKEYGGEEVRLAEEQRTEKKKAERAALRAKYVDGPTLTLPMMGGNFTFDPNGVQALEGVGSVYRTLSLTAAWGSLEATGGALITKDWANVIVPASGEGYTLKLNDGWVQTAGTVVKQ